MPQPHNAAELAHHLAHELKGPLMGIKGLASTATRLYSELSDEERYEFFVLLDSEATRLARVAEQVASVIVLEADDLRYTIEDLEVDELIGAAAEGHDRVRAPAITGLRLKGDPRRTAQILETLVDNAESYSEGDIEIGATARDGNIDIRVRDNGPGLPPDLQAAAFERFTTVRPPGYDGVPGAGLGLYLGLIFAQAQGGSLSMEALAEGGTMLRLLLPQGS